LHEAILVQYGSDWVNPAKPVGHDLAHDTKRCERLKIRWQGIVMSIKLEA